ncbi:hypothetical protein H2203_006590 [Taxawa tesnikishii (nom. ined.)]|nr:hypothetical protein H2203_006590 [Dothideales sp. JES 119]
MPQRHFSRVPDLDLGLGKAPENGAVPGSKGFFCGFGSLENTNSGATTTVNNLVLVGSAGGLDAYRVLRQRMDVVGRLEGLRGGVIGAKILPWTDRFDPFQELRPLIALTIHGATIGRQHSTSHDNRDEVSQSDTGGLDEKRHFQTTVEVYSLRTAQHVSTLFEGPLVTAEHPLDHPLFLPPAPVGEICVSAEGTFVTVASGKSGEIYIFTPYKHPAIGNQRAFRCIGKVWTTTKERSARPSSTTESKVEKQEEPQPGPRMAVYSLSSRWLAIVPPSVSSQQFTIDGSPVCSEYNPNPPGLSSVISPAAPLVNCETDAPKDDGMLNRVTRQAAQEVRKGAQWVGEQGAQAWKNYWNKPASSQQNGSTIAHKSSASEPQSAFPPTHGHSNTSAQFINEPACVSIIDLQRLLSFEEGKIKNALSPLATFEIGDGCSFVSFAPNGLTLLTTNNNGDTSTAWNLMEMTSGSATGVPQNGNNSMIQQSVGLIKRIARFPRLSPSIVVDVIWTVQGDRFAILTDKGTVHLHELSKPEFKLSSHQSPMSPPASRSGLPSPSTSPQADLPANGWMSNMRAGWQGLQSAAARTRSGSNGFALPTLSTLGNATATARYAGSRAVRNGLHRGFDMAAEGAHHIRHAEDNKIRLHPVHHGIGPGNVKWLSGRERGLVATITDGRVYLYSIKDISHVQGKKTVTSLAASKKHVADFNLQRICGDAIVPAIQGILDPAGPHASCSDQGPHGFWTLARSSNVRRPSTVGVRNSSSGAVTQDKETNPPYMPFHREPQVSLFVFNEKDSKDLAANLGVDNTEPWIFGLPLPSASKINCQQFDSDDDYGQGIADGELEGLMGKMEDLSAKPTIKSKGRKSRHAVEVDDDDLVEL